MRGQAGRVGRTGRGAVAALRRNTLAVVGLSGLAVALPLLGLFGRNPEFFVARDAGRAEIAFFAVTVALAPPAALLVIEATAYLISERAGRAAHALAVGVLGLALGLVTLGRSGIPAGLAVAGALALGTVLATFEERQGLNQWLRWLSPAPLVALVVFGFFSRSSPLVTGSEAAAVEVGVARPTPVVMVILDEFAVASLLQGDGSIDEERFPGFARLARRSTWFRNATAVSPWTPLSVSSLLTGNLPQGNEVPTSISHRHNIFTLLGATYDMRVHEEITDLCPTSICDDAALAVPGVVPGGGIERVRSMLLDAAVVYGHVALPDGLRDGLPSIDRSWGNFIGQDRVDATRPDATSAPLEPESGTTASTQMALLEKLVAGVGPGATLHLAHVVLPHFPWDLAPGGLRYTAGDARYDDLSAIPGLEEGDHWGDDTGLVRQGLQRHLLQVGAVDDLIGDLVEQLEETGIADEAVVVVTADHGVSFVPSEPRRGPTAGNLDEIYRVPLFVSVPGRAGGEVSDDPVTLLDVLPTIVDALDIDTDWAFDGRPLFDARQSVTERPAIEAPDDTMPTAIDGLYEVVRRNAATFNGRPGWLGVASAGPYGDLVGTPVDQATEGEASGVTATIDQTAAFSRVDRGSGYVPLLVSGTLEGAAAGAGELLVAIDGTVAGTGAIYESDGQTRFSALVAEELLPDGEHTAEVLLPEGSRLLRVRTSGP